MLYGFQPMDEEAATRTCERPNIGLDIDHQRSTALARKLFDQPADGFTPESSATGM